MSNNAIITVALPNYNVSTAGAYLGFGHAGVITVIDGKATYYEYGLYPNNDDNKPFLSAASPTGNGAIRSIPLGSVDFDNNGNIRQDSLLGILNNIFGSSGMYKYDTGEAVVSQFNIMMNRQAK
jgi:hypothetical protein